MERVLSSGQLTLGPRVAEFEDLVARHVGVPHAVAVSSRTAALQIAIRALGEGHGDEVHRPRLHSPRHGEGRCGLRR